MLERSFMVFPFSLLKSQLKLSNFLESVVGSLPKNPFSFFLSHIKLPEFNSKRLRRQEISVSYLTVDTYLYPKSKYHPQKKEECCSGLLFKIFLRKYIVVLVKKNGGMFKVVGPSNRHSLASLIHTCKHIVIC